jgi:hypothetical protein
VSRCLGLAAASLVALLAGLPERPSSFRFTLATLRVRGVRPLDSSHLLLVLSALPLLTDLDAAETLVDDVGACAAARAPLRALCLDDCPTTAAFPHAVIDLLLASRLTITELSLMNCPGPVVDLKQLAIVHGGVLQVHF